MECYVEVESSLNAAHFQHRKARNFTRLGKFDLAIGHHQMAADLLKDAMQVTKSDKALESIRLQHDYHVRQDVVIRFKQQQADKLRKRLQKKKLSEIERGDSEQTVSASPEDTNGNIQHEIYRTLEENDSLLAFLIQTKNQLQLETTVKTQETIPEIETNDESIISRGHKMPKDDKTLMEELRTNNDDLKQLVQRLLSELDKCNEEKQQLQELLHNIHVNSASRDTGKMSHVEVAVDSSLPSVFSSSGDLSSEELPPLVPLELPNFDFDLFQPKNN
uniref:Nuclear receptor-binding factor 2 MIT domain-containing protein n=1 Tax=Strigamia maritima TaxID=126957 RepID=T1II09_STRMM